jgi:hypothetical protein
VRRALAETPCRRRVHGEGAALLVVAVVLGLLVEPAHAVRAFAARRVVRVELTLVGVEAARRHVHVREAAGSRLLAHQVHATRQRVAAVEIGRGALQHLDAPDVVQMVEARLGLGGAVHQNRLELSESKPGS